MAAKKPDEQEENAKPKKCFVMMPISDVDGYPPGHFLEVYAQLICPAVEAAGYECEWAPSTSAAHMIQLDIVTKAATFDLAICDLSTRNGNVLFEYGIRQAFDKPTVLIRDDKTARLFDVLGFRDVEYDHTLRVGRTLAAREQITKAIHDTVTGSVDGSQIFSLITLMKLTKAALPAGEISRDDARFALLESKIDAVAGLLSRDNRSSIVQFPAHLDPASYGVSGLPYIFRISDDSVTVHDRQTGEITMYGDMRALQEAEEWRALNINQRKALNERITKNAPRFQLF